MSKFTGLANVRVGSHAQLHQEVGTKRRINQISSSSEHLPLQTCHDLTFMRTKQSLSPYVPTSKSKGTDESMEEGSDHPSTSSANLHSLSPTPVDIEMFNTEEELRYHFAGIRKYK